MEIAEGNKPQKSNKDFFWLLIGTIALILALMLLKLILKHFNMIE